MANLVDLLLNALAESKAPSGAPDVPPLPLRPPPPPPSSESFALPNVHSNFDPQSGRFMGNGGPTPPPFSARNPGPPLPMPNPAQRGAPPLPTLKPPPPSLAAAAPGGAPPMPAPNPQRSGSPPLPTRRPPPPLPERPPAAGGEPSFFYRVLSGGGKPDPVINWIRENVPGVERLRQAIHGEGGPQASPPGSTPMPPAPARRPGLPGLPGTIVDDNAPDIRTALEQTFGGVPIAQGMPPPRALDAVGGPAQGTPRPPMPAPTPKPYPVAGGASGGAAGGTPSADGPSGIGPFQTEVRRAGPAITPGDVQAFFRALAAGAAAADPTAPPLTAFAQGMSGALSGRRKEKKEDDAAALAADEREFNRRMKEAENRREEAREKRETRKAEIQNAKAVTEIMRELGGSLTTDQRFKFEKQITDYARAINPDGMMSREDLKAALDEYRTDLERRFGINRGQGAQPAGGDGSSPQAAARPSSRADFDALPSGAYFVNPADGRILRKK